MYKLRLPVAHLSGFVLERKVLLLWYEKGVRSKILVNICENK